MRITQGILSEQLLSTLRQSQTRLARLQDQLATGRRVNRPADDPVAIVSVLRLRSSIEEANQLAANVSDAREWLTVTEEALAGVTDILNRAHELAVQGGNSSLPPASMQALAEEAAQLLQHAVQLANAQYSGRYVFSGHLTDTPAFQVVGTTATYQGDAGTIAREIAPGVTLDINLLGDQTFGAIFNDLSSLAANLANGDHQAISSTDLANLDADLDNLLAARAQVGAKLHRAELSEERLKSLSINFERVLSDVEDVDLARTILELQQEEVSYRVALQAGARIIQPTLVDFLR